MCSGMSLLLLIRLDQIHSLPLMMRERGGGVVNYSFCRFCGPIKAMQLISVHCTAQQQCTLLITPTDSHQLVYVQPNCYALLKKRQTSNLTDTDTHTYPSLNKTFFIKKLNINKNFGSLKIQTHSLSTSEFGIINRV